MKLNFEIASAVVMSALMVCSVEDGFAMDSSVDILRDRYDRRLQQQRQRQLNQEIEDELLRAKNSFYPRDSLLLLDEKNYEKDRRLLNEIKSFVTEIKLRRRSSDVSGNVCFALNVCQERFGDRSKNAQELIMIHWREIDANNSEGRLALKKAIIDGNEELIECLVRNGADVNDVDGNGTSAVTLAEQCGNDTAIHLIVLQQYLCVLKLSSAIEDGRYDEVKRLVESGADINSVITKHGDTPLMHAVQNGHFDIAEYLVKRGADVSKRDDRGRMAQDFVEDGLREAKFRIERVLGI